VSLGVFRYFFENRIQQDALERHKTSKDILNSSDAIKEHDINWKICDDVSADEARSIITLRHSRAYQNRGDRYYFHQPLCARVGTNKNCQKNANMLDEAAEVIYLIKAVLATTDYLK
jgi:hypothetical protein